MCFSATASFLVSAGTAAAGGITVRQAKPKERLFAAIPVLFAVQQLLEGFQWLALDMGSPNKILGYGFLFFAFILWPTYIPLAIRELERNAARRRVLSGFLVAGLAMSITLLLFLISQPLTITALPRGIQYLANIPYGLLGPTIYVAVTGGALLVSTDRWLRWFGVGVSASAACTAAIWQETFTSVWCFFAAAFSVLIYFYIRRRPTSSR